MHRTRPQCSSALTAYSSSHGHAYQQNMLGLAYLHRGSQLQAACIFAACACSVGFNAIYHLTDVPSFVSGEHLVRCMCNDCDTTAFALCALVC
jgi:hypothetical protein